MTTTTTTSSDTPIEFDTFGPLGGPRPGVEQGSTATVSYSASPIVAGLWADVASQVGPYPAGGVTPVPVTSSMKVRTLGFDNAVEPTTGDLSKVSLNPDTTFDAVTVAPGQTATIGIKIKPTSSGLHRGVAFIDAAQLVETYYGTFISPNANQVAAVPYAYTAKK